MIFGHVVNLFNHVVSVLTTIEMFTLEYLNVRNYLNHVLKILKKLCAAWSVLHLLCTKLHHIPPSVSCGTAGHPTRGVWPHTLHHSSKPTSNANSIIYSNDIKLIDIYRNTSRKPWHNSEWGSAPLNKSHANSIMLTLHWFIHITS